MATASKLREEAQSRIEKPCKVCKITKRLDEFSKQNTVIDGHKSTCKKCLRVISARLYRKRQLTFANAKKLSIIEQMGGGCSDCGLSPSASWPAICFDFHHTGPKKFSMSKLLRSAKNHDSPHLKDEAALCVVLCSNCHKRRHYLSNTLGVNSP